MKHSLDQVPVFTKNIWKKCWKKQILQSVVHHLLLTISPGLEKLQLECSFQK